VRAAPEGLAETDEGEKPIATDAGQEILRGEKELLGLDHLVVAGQPT
jgi:hypothetical protein